jgi:hypothetical protein
MSHRLRLVVILAVSVVAIAAEATVARAQAPDPAASARATPAELAAWQAEIDRAIAQHSSGVKTQFVGVGVFLGGIGLMGYGVTCDHCSGAGPFVGGLIVTIAGAATTDVGHGRAHDGSLTRSWLESHGPAPLPSSAWQSEFDGQLRKKSTGRKTRLAGLFMAGAGLLIVDTRQTCTYGYLSPCSRTGFAIGQSFLLAGGVVGGIGSQMAHDADLTMKLLHSHAPSGPMSLPMAGADVGSGLSVSVGRTTSFSWRLRW